MYVLLYFLWIILNGKITVEIVVLGIAVTGILNFFISKFMSYSLQKEIYLYRKVFYLLKYLLVLIVEVVKANIFVLKYIVFSGREPEPVLIHFDSHLKTDFARVLLANAITLTPGTITVSMEENWYQIHCLDKELAGGMEAFSIIPILRKMEGDVG